MVRQLFGTDGVRGVAGEFPLDPKTTHALGAALADVAARMAPSPEVVIGMDTRESGPWLAAQVAGGLAGHGARVRFAGVTTTPGVAYLTRTGAFVAGVMISASHNPYRDNGIKIFSHSGYKLPDDREHAIEQEIFALLEAGVEPAPATLTPDPGLDRHYLEYLASTVGRSFKGLDMVVDCGNGAASGLAPELLERLGGAMAIGYQNRSAQTAAGVSPVPGSEMPISACLDSPGPLTMQPMIATFNDSTPG